MAISTSKLGADPSFAGQNIQQIYATFKWYTTFNGFWKLVHVLKVQNWKNYDFNFFCAKFKKKFLPWKENPKVVNGCPILWTFGFLFWTVKKKKLLHAKK